jgi:hypothetical protein
MTGAGTQIDFSKLIADLGCPRRRGEGGGCGSGFDLLLRGWQQKISFFDAGFPFALKQATGTAEPSGCLVCLAAKSQAEPKPECSSRSTNAGPPIDISVMGALQNTNVILVPADKVGRRCQPFEVFDTKRSRFVGKRQVSKGLMPSLSIVSLATKGEPIRLLQGASIVLPLI